jgi:hypothetical protein
MMEEQDETSAEQAVSRTSDVEAAVLRVWKNPAESRRSVEMAWQSVKLESARKFLKKLGQDSVVKLLDRLVSKAVGKLDDIDDRWMIDPISSAST